MPPKDKSGSRVSQEIGLRIRARRNELDMTQTELAEAVGVSQQQINKYESGNGRIPAEQLLKLCQTLGIALDSLFMPLKTAGLSSVGFAEAEQTPFSVTAFADKDMLALVRMFQSISDKRVRKKVLNLIAAIIDEEPDAPAGKG